MTRNTNSDHFTGRVDFITSSGNASHYYRIDGKKAPGVTTIINGGIPKPGLISWSAEQAAIVALDREEEWNFLPRDEALAYIKAEHIRVRDAAGARGTHMHQHAEHHMRTGSIPEDVPEDAAVHIAHLAQFLADFNPALVMAEYSGINRKHNYAGTADVLLTFPHAPEWGNVLCDYKSKTKTSIELGEKNYPVGPYAEVALQLVAYRNFDTIIADDGSLTEPPRVDTCAAVCVYPDGYTFHLVDAGDAEWATFLAAKDIYEFGLRGRRKGDTPVRPPEVVPDQSSLFAAPRVEIAETAGL